MTATTTTTARRRGRPLANGTLVSIEAPRALRSPALWVGLAVTVYAWLRLDADYSAGEYQATMALFAPLAAGIYVLGVLAGSRDRILDAGPLCPESVVDADGRARARLLGLWPAVAIGIAWVAVVAVAERVDGGDWIGEPPGPVDDVLHGPVEWLQPALLVLLAATAGVAIGRVTRQRIVTGLLGVMVFALFGMMSWAWQWHPAVFVALVQTQPVEVELGRGIDANALPPTWWLSAPGQYDATWGRLVIHTPMAAWHGVYLAGLVLLCAGLAVRRHGGRQLVMVGAGVAVLGVAAQVLVAPANFG